MMQIMLSSNYFSNANVEMETQITSFFFLWLLLKWFSQIPDHQIQWVGSVRFDRVFNSAISLSHSEPKNAGFGFWDDLGKPT